MARYPNPPLDRPLKVYAFDPSGGRRLANHVTVRVPFEELQPGPVGEKIAVIDYDSSNRRYYSPVDLDARDVLIRGGLEPSETDPRFHQQMVYAVAMETVRRFELALGRPVRWRRPARNGGPYRRKLRILPHGIQEANAFYDPELRALIFGYFRSNSLKSGSNLPGQTIFTCLSHDIVVHETAHALVDGLRENFMIATHDDTPAFHEAFADIVAIFQHFSFEEALVEAIRRTGGYPHRGELEADAPAAAAPRISAERRTPNPLIELARQFGEGAGVRGALRSAIGESPDPARLESVTAPHERGAILVAAVFDAYFSVYARQARPELARLARGAEIPLETARRLAARASKIARGFAHVCIRALDYCPPVDIRFGEYLRAMITADMDLEPGDPLDYRAALIDAFRARGIAPEGARSWSEESLRWEAAEAALLCEGLKFDFFGDHSGADYRRNARALHRFASAHAAALRLDPGTPVRVYSFAPLMRVGPDGQPRFQYVVELLQRKKAAIDPANGRAGTFPFLGGATLVLERNGAVRYAIAKSVTSRRRLEEERRYRRRAAPPVTPRAAHRGY
jgi:hypothetical protein